MTRALTLLCAGLALAGATLPVPAAANPYANTNAYVVSTSAGTVTVVDTATATVRATLPVVAGPSRVVVSPDGTKAYVSHPAAGVVTVIDAALLSVTATITTAAGPGELAVSPDGHHLFVSVSGGIQIIALADGHTVATVPLGGVSELVFSPDGSRAYAAHGVLSVIEVATLSVTSTSIAATALALMPNGQRLYTSAASGAIHEVDTTTNTVFRTIAIPGTSGPLALTPDGSRLYAGIQGTNLVCSVYGCGGVAFRNVTVYETAGNAVIATIALGSPTNRLAVTPTRADLYMLVPSTSLSIVSVNTNRARLTLPLGAGVNDLAMTPDPNAVIVPYLIDAVNDAAPATIVNNYTATAVTNVLANDTLGGVPARLSTVTLSEVSSTAPGLALDAATGAVTVEAGTPAGAHALVYRICETASPANCDQATVSVNVRLPYVIDAVDDIAVTNPGKTAGNALANDTLNGLPATTATVRVSQVATSHSGVAMSTAGFVFVSTSTPMGLHSLVYRICEAASLQNCDVATVTVEVIPHVVDAVDDAGAVTRTGGTAVANVLANDKFGTTVATLGTVSLSLVSAPIAGITLNVANGAVTVSSGAALGVHALTYRICDLTNPTNCDHATVAVTVNPYYIDAVNDSARGSSKVPNTPIASVLNNDTLGGVRATVSTVRIELVSMFPANPKVRLDVTDGSVDVLGKTDSGLYSIVYRICEIANPSNCDQASVTLDLSGK